MTSRFNQDIVENWFSCIRQKGLNNDSRTSWEYELAGRAITVNWMLTSVSKHSNCEVDFDHFIGVMSDIHKVPGNNRRMTVGVTNSTSDDATALSVFGDNDIESALHTSQSECKYLLILQY